MQPNNTPDVILRVTFPFCFAHRLVEAGPPCCYIHGHNAKAVIALRGNPANQKTWVCDVRDVQTGIGNWISTNWDHNILIWKQDPLLTDLSPRQLSFISMRKSFYIMDAHPTIEMMAVDLKTAADAWVSSLGSKVSVAYVSVEETDCLSAAVVTPIEMA